MNERVSPWWYRRRDLVFALLYFVGFWLGTAIWRSSHGGTVTSVIALAGRYWGNAGTLSVFLLGVLSTLLCFAVRFWGSSYLRAAIVWSANARTDAIVVDGPFRYVRNPLYLGNLLMAAGIGVLATPFGWVLIMVLHLIYIEMLIRWEERSLFERYGDAFAAYCRRVPQLLPRLAPAHAVNAVAPDVNEGLQAEIFSLAVVAAMLALLMPLSFDLYVFWAILAFGMILQRIATRTQP